RESMVIVTGSPAATFPASASGKPTFTTMWSRSRSVAKAFDEPDDAEAPLPEPELEAELDRLLPPPPTVWPTVKLTAEIVPAAGALRVVASRAFWASLTASWAECTAAVAWAMATGPGVTAAVDCAWLRLP